MSYEESDVTIGPGKLLGLFFMLVVICGVFFAIGYSLGKTSAREQALNDKTPLNASLSSPVVGDANAAKPSAAVAAKSEPDPNAAAEQEKAPNGPDLTFFNEVKKSSGTQAATTDAAKDANGKPATPKPTDTTVAKTQPPAVTSASTPTVSNAPATTAQPASPSANNAAKGAAGATVTSAGNGAYVVQIAAVTREEDAAALAGALRKKSYSVFVVNNPAVHDKFYHVQVGPFATLQDAEAMKTKLASEGYNPIVKKS